MAQKPKKNHIAEVALPLFLEHGFKATSIDLVVKQSGVSKPTVYNHFPDKSALFIEVLTAWIASRTPRFTAASNNAALDNIIQNHWLTNDTVRFYALIIGEGSRIPEAKHLFWTTFDQVWREAIIKSGKIGRSSIDSMMDSLLLDRLKNL